MLIGAADGSGKRLSAFGQAGFADARTNRFSSYFGAGIVGSSWGPMRDADQTGISFAHARNGKHYMNAAMSVSPRHAETTIELSYQTRVSSHMTVQPDVQYVVHPNTDPSLANAVVVQLRFEIAF